MSLPEGLRGSVGSVATSPRPLIATATASSLPRSLSQALSSMLTFRLPGLQRQGQLAQFNGPMLAALTHLDLSGTWISRTGYSHLALALQDHPKLTKVCGVCGGRVGGERVCVSLPPPFSPRPCSTRRPDR